MAINAKNLKRPGREKPPQPEETNNNLKKLSHSDKVPLQPWVDPVVRREFRLYAMERDLDTGTLFEQVWTYYKENHG